MWVHLYDPHDPYQPPPPFSVNYKDHLYDGEIAYADSALGDFVAHLKQRGWYENAVIIVVGDHGEGLGEHKEETHGVFLYDSTLHVPLIVKPPGKISPRTVQTQARTTDIFPTVLDLLHIDAPPQLDGESLKGILHKDETHDRTVIAETDYPLHFGWAPLRAVRTDGMKFIETPRPELYDLRNDPGEVHNTYEPWSETVQKSRKVLADRWERMPRPAPTSATVGTGTLDELTALGYLGPADAGSATNVPEPSMLPDPKDKIGEQNLLHSAMMAAEAGRTVQARSALEKVLDLNPKSETALVQLGNLSLRAGDYQKAVGYLSQARRLNPKDATAALYEGEAREKSGDLSGAKSALETCVKLSPKQSADARALLGQVYLRLQDYAAAEDQFEATLLMQPENLEGHLGLARIEILQRRFDEALNDLLPLSKAHPGEAQVFELLAQTYSGLGKETEAARAKMRAKELAVKAKSQAAK
jgi:Flp pilus assembly protein TadD